MRVLPDTEIARVHAVAAARHRSDPSLWDGVSSAMAYLDRCGARFEAVRGWPGWYAARWDDHESFDEPRRWACCIEEWDREYPYALAFKARTEAGARS